MGNRFLGALILLVCTACGSGNDPGPAALAAVRDGALLVDVRTAEEFRGGHLPGAINIPHTEIVEVLAGLRISPDRQLVLYCRSGNRAGIAASSLEHAGYAQVMNAGGYSTLASLWQEQPPGQEQEAAHAAAQ